ncbi:retrovirus-related pol polyprotein from transposon TNT 1-94 [Tanacetum coccineum]
MDINNAFLHGDLNEEVCMKVPQGYAQNLPPNTVCKLTKSIYGLKQANRQWFEKLTTFLIQLGFKQSYVDTSLFTITHKGIQTSLLVYVDDILIVSKDTSFITLIKQHLHTKFSIKDLDFLNLKPIATPMDPISKLNDTDGYLLLDPSTYRMLVGISWNIPSPSLVICDNASIIALAKNPIHHARAKHIEIDCHFVKDKIKQG